MSDRDVLAGRQTGSADPEALQRQVLEYARDLRVALQRSREATRDLARTHLETVAALAAAVDVRDEVTGGHVYRVANYGAILARDLAPDLVDDPQLVYGFLLHDIGKLAIPDAVLRKEGPLDPEEQRIMRSHVEHGIRFVKGVSFLRPALNIIATHHEHVDGSGYPRGLRTDEIPLAARMFIVCDAFDAMVHDRPYRDALPAERALSELGRHGGTQFDPDVIAAVERNLDGLTAVEDRPAIPSLSAAAMTGRRRRDAQQAGHQVFDAVDQAMVLMSPDGAIQDANPRFLDLFGLVQAPVGMLLHELVDRSVLGLGDRADARTQWEQLERDLFHGRREGRFVQADGRAMRWFSNVILGEGDAVIGRVLVVDHHTEPVAAGVVEDLRTTIGSTLPDLQALADELGLLAGVDETDDATVGARAQRVRDGLERLEALARRLESDVADEVEADGT
ncbi:MAG: HD domain-containing protein [Actinobacteria bacterium]|nr:HD domain-containing protein [Actinomycetota bacterium]